MNSLSLQNTNSHANGFTLFEAMVVIAIIAVLAALAAPIYHRHILNARLHNTKQALLENTQFLEKFYAQNARFTLNATTWPDLPTTNTDYFDISFKGTARGARAGTYRLQAIAKDSTEEPRYLLIDQNHTMQLCVTENNRTQCQSP